MNQPTPLKRASGSAQIVCLLLVAVWAAAATGCAPVTDRAVRGQADQFQSGLAPAEIQDPAVNNYINQVGRRIVDAGRDMHREGIGPKAHFDDKESEDWMFRDIQFHVVNSKTLNAFTTGGNHIYIYNELLQLCENEDELAAVMAHEYAHIYGRHVQKGTSRQWMQALPALLLGGAGYLAGGKESGGQYAALGAGLGAVGGQLATAHFTRADEAEADDYGFRLYTRAGWDPRRFGDFFARLAQKSGDSTPEVLSDHPSLANRVKAARERAERLGPNAERFRREPVLAPRQFAQLQERSNAIAARTPDDKSLQNTQTLLQALPRSCLYEEEPNPPSARRAQQAIQQEVQRAEEGRARQGQGRAR